MAKRYFLIALGLLWGLSSVSSAYAQTFAQTFDCQKPASLATFQRFLCKNSALLSQERVVMEIYRQLRQVAPSGLRLELRRTQRHWHRLQRKCRQQIPCLQKLYQERLLALSKLSEAQLKHSVASFSGLYHLVEDPNTEGQLQISVAPNGQAWIAIATQRQDLQTQSCRLALAEGVLFEQVAVWMAPEPYQNQRCSLLITPTQEDFIIVEERSCQASFCSRAATFDGLYERL